MPHVHTDILPLSNHPPLLVKIKVRTHHGVNSPHQANRVGPQDEHLPLPHHQPLERVLTTPLVEDLCPFERQVLSLVSADEAFGVAVGNEESADWGDVVVGSGSIAEVLLPEGGLVVEDGVVVVGV